MQKNFYIRNCKGREIVRVNLYAVAGLVLAFIVAVCCVVALSGCAYRVIPEKAHARVVATVPVVSKQAADARKRAIYHEEAAKAAPTPEAAQGHVAAAAEANHAAKVESYVAEEVAAGMEESKPAGQFAIEQAEPFVRPVLAGAGVAAGGGIPWTEIILGVSTLATAAFGVKRHIDAHESNQAHAWEEACAADPELGGSEGNLNYNDPRLKARALRDVATGKLSKGAFKKTFPQG